MKKTKLLTLMLLSASLLSGCGGTKEVDNTNQLNLDRLDLLMNPLGDGSYDVVATVTPSYATNKELTWELLWDSDDASETDDDAWKEGKTITDYITKTISEDTFTANIKNVAAFGSQAKVKVSVTAKPSVNASLTINYRKKNEIKEESGRKLILKNTTSQCDMTVPYYVQDSIGSLLRTEEQNVTYEYANYFVWFKNAGPYVHETWNAEISVSNSGQTHNNLLAAIGQNISYETGRTISTSVFYNILSGPGASYCVLEDFAYAINEHPSASDWRAAGASLSVPYKMYLNGTRVNSGQHGTQWNYALFDVDQFILSPQGLSFNQGSIEF